MQGGELFGIQSNYDDFAVLEECFEGNE